MLRQFYLMSVASAAVLAPLNGAYAQETTDQPSATAEDLLYPLKGDIDPFKGDIDPFKGDIDPFAGDINPFAGDINPFRGDINPFYGDVSPFWGDINPFWGDINPFKGDIDPMSGDINPFWGDIDPFSGDINPQSGDIDPFSGDIQPFDGGLDGLRNYWETVGPQWGDINAQWGALGAYGSDTQAAYASVLTDLQSMVSFSDTNWNSAVMSTTGQSFNVAFADPLFAKYGLDLSDASTLENLDAYDRSRFFMEWYDGLMAYSGMDRVDHWMPAVNWTPAITQDQGEGHDAIVGLLDVRISTSDDNIQYLSNLGGYDVSVNEHGAAVAGLIAARHDGEGVMGIAPRANVYAYSPFDNSGSASWKDVTDGIHVLADAGANVINMSLGYPNFVFHQKMANIFTDPSMSVHQDNTVFVIAAGNEGKTQTSDVNWDAGVSTDNLLLVGSVDPTLTVSYFSNRPGEACFSVNNTCNEQDKLKYRFLVAPGEMLLVSDNNGGTTRLSGTSFAAPLVTGAVSLIHDRWPWLQQHAEETTSIILQSAQDLGDPGVDSEYGWGLLDVEAAQSPLSFDTLQFYMPKDDDDEFESISTTYLQDLLLNPGMLDLWELEGASLVAIENIGDTHRDFLIPLSTLLYGQSGTFDGNTEQYQRHVYSRLVDWASGSNFAAQTTPTSSLVNYEGLTVSMFAAPVSPFAPSSIQDAPYEMGFQLKSQDGTFVANFGDGAGLATFGSSGDFTSFTDFDPETGGVNPFLGLATGGSYANATKEVLPGLQVGLGFSQVNDDHTYADATTGQRLDNVIGFADFKASATMLNVSYAVAKNVTLNTTYTSLTEENSILGAQGTGAFSFNDGAVSNALTMGSTIGLSKKWSLSTSATVGKTNGSATSDGLLSLSDEGAVSTAFQISAKTKGLLSKKDSFAVSFAQPLHIETGAIRYQSVQVVDRATGELGNVNEFWALGGNERRVVGEMEYMLSVLEDTGSVSIYGRMDLDDVDIGGEYDAYVGGARFELKF